MFKSKVQLGLVSVSFRNHSPREILSAVKDAKLDCIEWGSDVHAPCSDKVGLQEIASLQKEYGISCSSYGTYFNLGETPIDDLDDYIAAAKTLGTDVLRLWCGTKSGDKMTSAERDKLFKDCKLAAAKAEKQDVTLCMEWHINTFTQRIEDALLLLKTVNSPKFRMYWQPFQWLDYQDNLKIAQAIAPFVENIHIFNWKGSGRFTLAEAVKEWRSYLGEFSCHRALLLEFMPDDRIESLKGEAEALKIIVKELENSFA